MSLLKSNSVQIGQSATATQNFTLSVPSSPDGTIKLARGNSGATTADVLSINASGVITGSTFSGATISGSTITSSTVDGGTITSATAQASTSGTAIDFTGIPSWVKRVTVMLNEVSLSSTSHILIQLGISSGIENTSYKSQSSVINTAVATINSTSGFVVYAASGAASASGSMAISSMTGNLWASAGGYAHLGTTASAIVSGGVKQLGGVLDRIRITSTGADTFDAGSINIMYEG